MSTSLRAAITSFAFVVLCSSSGSAAGHERDVPNGYVLLTGEEARQALAGNLFRVAVREVTRKDGSKATVYRDVDYPVRSVPGAGAGSATKKSDDDGKKDGDDDVGDDDDAPSGAGENAQDQTGKAEREDAPREFSVYVFFGPEYEDPPAAGSSPSPNRSRRAGPASVTYVWDEPKETGKGDELLRLEFDFSGTKPVIKSGYWQMEAEAGEVEKETKEGFDFLLGMGAYGQADGKIETHDLHLGAPDEIMVGLAFHSESLPAGKLYRLKRQPAAD